MKKLNYLLLGAAGLLMASCSNEEIQNPAAEIDGNYRVTVKLPQEMATRAMNDGLTATQLKYTIYDVSNGNTKLGEGTGEFDATSLSTTVDLNLPKGNKYAISFFAYAPGSENVYLYNADEKTLTVAYDQMNNEGMNADTYDCFLNLLETGTIGTDLVQESIVLYRPIAQINWGANDLKNATNNNAAPLIAQYFGTPVIASTGKENNNVLYPFPYMQSQLSTQAYNTFDLLANDVDTEAGKIDAPFKYMIQPVSGNTVTGFPVTGYTYVAMQYVLAPKSETIYDLTLNIDNGNTSYGGSAGLPVNYDVNVASAPVQANYRTNIYGSLFTENVTVQVVKSPNWGGQYNLPQGEGEQVDGAPEGLLYNAATKTYTIMNANALEYYSTDIAGKATQQGLSGYTVLLGDNIDMKNVEHTPINNAGATFDGQDFTISNLTVVAQNGASAGFFSNAIGTVQNINFTDATITGNYKAAVVAADAMAARIYNCHVDGAVVTSTPWDTAATRVGGTYDDANNVGGIAGYLSAENSGTVTNCSVKNAKITAYRKVGGIVGYANGKCYVAQNSVSNTTVTANQHIDGDGEYTGSEPYPYLAGEICGGWTDDATVRDNSAESVSVITISSDNEVSASVSSQEALQSAVGTPNATITLQPGNYDAPNNMKSGITFTGTKETVFNFIDMGNRLPKGGYNDVTFKGITIQNPSSGNYYGIQGTNITFEDCDINNTYFGYGQNVTFNNCVFTSSNWCMWSYTAQNLVFNGCTFNCEVGKGINVYNETAGETWKLSFTDCDFIAAKADNGDKDMDGKAALMLKVTNGANTSTFDVTLTNCTATGFSTNTYTGNQLWSYQEGAKYVVNENGTVTDSSN